MNDQHQPHTRLAPDACHLASSHSVVLRTRGPFSSVSRPGFTLVEILVVISIIAILAGIAIPAINGAVRGAREAAIRTEIDVIGQALESYKLQHGDYPPDFSDWNAVERHFRKAYPSIDDSELKLLAQFTWLDSNFNRVPLTMGNVDPRTGTTYAYYRQCIDPAEALVFCLGGFSSDKKRPFTGQGGPFARIGMPGMMVTADYGKYQYNIERSNAVMELKTDQLSVFVANDPTATPTTPNPAGAGSAYTYSKDEYVPSVDNPSSVVGTSATDAYSPRGTGVRFLVDPFPVYTVNENAGPLVYFNSSSYTRTFTPPTITGGWVTTATEFHSLNVFYPSSGDPEQGVARPYLLNQPNTVSGGFMWAENKKFQLVSAGLDGSFGGSVASGVVPTPITAMNAGNAGPVAIFPTGQFAIANGNLLTADKYEDPESIYRSSKPQLDNITNFSTRTLEGDLP